MPFFHFNIPPIFMAIIYLSFLLCMNPVNLVIVGCCRVGQEHSQELLLYFLILKNRDSIFSPDQSWSLISTTAFSNEKNVMAGTSLPDAVKSIPSGIASTPCGNLAVGTQ
jgi:hypothetical protein